MNTNKVKRAGAIFITSMVVACSTIGNPPNALNTHAQSEIQMAKESGAEEYAPLAFRSATQHFEKANAELEKENYAAASRLLEKAIADANYANAKTHAKKTQKASQEINANLDELKKAL